MEEEVKNIEFVSEEIQEIKEEIKEVKTTVVPKLFMKKDEKIKIEIVGFHSASTGQLAFVLPKEYSDEKNFDWLLSFTAPQDRDLAEDPSRSHYGKKNKGNF